jgi:hypothetical protein
LLNAGQTYYDSISGTSHIAVEHNGVTYTHILGEGQRVNGPFQFFQENDIIYLKGKAQSGIIGSHSEIVPILALDSQRRSDFSWPYISLGGSEFIDSPYIYERYPTTYSGADTTVLIDGMARSAHVFLVEPGRYFNIQKLVADSILIDTEWKIPLKFLLYSATEGKLTTTIFKANLLFTGGRNKQRSILNQILSSEQEKHLDSKWSGWEIIEN